MNLKNKLVKWIYSAVTEALLADESFISILYITLQLKQKRQDDAKKELESENAKRSSRGYNRLS